MGRTEPDLRWWNAPEGDVNQRVVQYISELERVQSSTYLRFAKLAYLYDPHDVSGYDIEWERRGTPDCQVSENVVAQNVDAIKAAIAVSGIRSRFIPTDGDWETQRRCKRLEWYAEEVEKLLDSERICEDSFKELILKGSCFIKVWTDWLYRQVRVEHVLVDDMLFPISDCRARKLPRQMHHRMFISKDELMARYPKFEDDIERAATNPGQIGPWRYIESYRTAERDEVLCYHSVRPAIGKPGQRGYVAGRESITIEGADLYDKPYKKDSYPWSRAVWSERDKGGYGIGYGERVAGHQREINRLNIQEDRVRDQWAFPTTYVRPADANLMVKTTNRIGNLAVVKGDYPKTVIPPTTSPEAFRRRQELKEGAYEAGMARMVATGTKPAGLDSGAALREYKDQTTGKFAPQEKEWERLRLDVVWRILCCCKELGENAPKVTKKTRYRYQEIDWADVDPGDMKAQISAAANLSRTPAGKLQTAMELSSQGIITQDETRKLLDQPDIDRAMSLYTAALDDIEACIEDIYDGFDVVPEPAQNLKMLVWRTQQEYLIVRHQKPPEDRLEALREFMVNGAHLLSMANEAAQMPAGPPQPEAPIAPSVAPEAMAAGLV